MSESDRPVVLIVEDEPDVAETYKLWLRNDYEVRMAHDGDEGLELLDDSVDVVLLDRMMPGLSGDEVLERIRERDLGCRVSMVTAVEPDFDILEMGYYSLVEKQATLEASKSSAELEENDEYNELKREIDELKDELSDSLGGIGDDADFIATLRGLSNGEDE